MSTKGGHSIYGNLDLLVLHSIEVEGPIHGLGIMDSIESVSLGDLEIDDGALYRCLHRLEDRGLLKSEWRVSEKGRQAKFYFLSPTGDRELARARSDWERHVRAVGRVLGLNGEIVP